MKTEFRKINFEHDSYNCAEKKSLLEDIAKTRFALETAYSGFDNATDPDLIDCYIYEVNSALKRYKYLLEEAAKLNIHDRNSVTPLSQI